MDELEQAAKMMYRGFMADVMRQGHTLEWEELPQLVRDAWMNIERRNRRTNELQIGTAK